MAIVEIITGYNHKHCLSCKDYEIKDGYWLCGKCVSQDTKVKSRNRYHNSKACGSHRFRSHTELKYLLEENE